MPRPRAALRLLLLALPLALLGAGGLPAGADEGPSPEITRGELKELVKRFASDDMKGREGGTPECDQAAQMIADEFERVGLRPLGTDTGSWFQEFTSPKGMRVLPGTALSVTDAEGRTTEFTLAQDFSPADDCGPGEARAGVVFAGYGIHAPDMEYDDYADLDVKGKVVVVLRHAPRWQDKRKSPFAPQNVMLRVGTFKAKADAAADRGAVALIVVNDPASTTRSDDDLRPPGGSVTGRLPVFQMTWEAGRRLGSRLGLPLQGRQRAIDGRFTPHSEAVEGAVVAVKADLAADVRAMKNVVGLLEPGARVTTGDGAPASAPGTVVLGAHYDHVGLGHFGSLSGADGQIHNGADDNASGTTALLEIAGLLASRREELTCRVLFVAFSGEELGLLGSKHYVREPRVPLAECFAMLNLDMVGRLDKNHLYVGGTGTSPVWPEMIERLNKEVGRFDLTSWPGGKAPSDHASFYEAGLPVLFFFTGLHGDYHRPSDDPRTLDYGGQERVARFAAAVALELATRGERPQFTRCDAGGFTVGPYTGLAVEQRAGGVFVAHVDKRSPAAKAGIKEDDRLVDWDDKPMTGTDLYNDLVSKAKPGDKVTVTVERGGRSRKIKLVLGKT